MNYVRMDELLLLGAVSMTMMTTFLVVERGWALY
jgi:hypothetical protein